MPARRSKVTRGFFNDYHTAFDTVENNIRGVRGPGAAERKRLGKELEKLDKGIRGIEGKLGNDKFLNKAPADVVQRERDRLATLQSERRAVRNALDALGTDG